MRALFLCILAAVTVYGRVAATVTAERTPGKAVFWIHNLPGLGVTFSHDQQANRDYDTTSIDASKLPQYLDKTSNKQIEVVVVLTTEDGRSPLIHSSVIDSIRGSDRSIMMPSIYKSHSANPATAFEHLKTADSVKNMQPKMTLLDFKHFLEEQRQQESSILNDNKVDAFHVTLSGHESEGAGLQQIQVLSKAPILFATVEEPGTHAAIPEANGHYSRILAVSSSSVLDGIYYKPEGAEYSIYYANTYLYLTPDIFTGALVGLFIVFTLLIGLSCLNGIQTNDMYASKACPVGKADG